MPRPRRLPDDELLTRIAASLEQRTEITPWSLADIASAAGIGPAGLIKRFGSKSGLLRALTERWIALIPRDSPTDGESPVAILEEYVAREFGASSVGGAIYALSEVLKELQDPELAALLARGWELQARRLGQLLEAMDLPRLKDSAVGGTLLLDALHGGLFRSAADPDQNWPLITLKRFTEMWK